MSYSFNGIRGAIDHFVVGALAPPTVSATYFNIRADAADRVSELLAE